MSDEPGGATGRAGSSGADAGSQENAQQVGARRLFWFAVSMLLFDAVFITVVALSPVLSSNPMVRYVGTTILALAGGALAALLPGFLDLSLKVVRAGGALAAFALVLYWAPVWKQLAPELPSNVTLQAGRHGAVELLAFVLESADRSRVTAEVWKALEGRSADLGAMHGAPFEAFLVEFKTALGEPRLNWTVDRAGVLLIYLEPEEPRR